MGVEPNLRSHWGALLVRWIYAMVMLGLGVGLSFLTQYLWEIRWYALFIPIVAVILLGMAYNTVNTLKTRVTHNKQGDGILVVDGVWGRREHLFLYSHMESYRTKPSRLNDKLGCVEIILEANRSVSEKETYTLCLSQKDADTLLKDLAAHLN